MNAAAAVTNTGWTNVNSGIFSASSEAKTGALLRLENVFIEDIGKCGAAAVERLSAALNRGVAFTKDRKRKRFYEVQVESESYYIHVLQGAAKVLLLARWARA